MDVEPKIRGQGICMASRMALEDPHCHTLWGMKSTQWHGIDLKALANEEPGVRVGEWEMGDFPRLAQELHPEHRASGRVSATLEVWWERPIGELQPQLWSRWTAHAELPLTCQRCLDACPQKVELQQTYRWVDTEAQAAQQDEGSEEDVLALEGEVDLLALLEDELIMALPAFVKHDACDLPLDLAPEVLEVPENPFAKLAALKKSGS